MFKVIVLLFVFGSQLAVSATCETKREIYIENKSTKVWKTTICPHQTLPFHSHAFARVAIPESDGQLQVLYRSGKTEMLKLEKQVPLFLSVAQGRESHQEVNTGSQPIQITVIELRKSHDL